MTVNSLCRPITRLREWIFWKYWIWDLTGHYTWVRYAMVETYFRLQEWEKTDNVDLIKEGGRLLKDYEKMVKRARKSRNYCKFFNIAFHGWWNPTLFASLAFGLPTPFEQLAFLLSPFLP